MDYISSIGGGVSATGQAQLGGGAFSNTASSPVATTSGMTNMGKLSAGLKVTGALFNAVGAYQQQKNIEVKSKYNRAVLSASEKVKQVAFDLQEKRVRESGDSLLSTQRAIIGGSGLAFSGSPVEVMRKSAEDIEFDIQMVKLNALSSEYETQNELQLLEIEQKSARRNKWAAAAMSFSGSLI